MSNREVNEHLSIIFLKFLYQHCHEGLINLRFLPKDSTKCITERFLSLDQIDSIPLILKPYEKEFHCFFGVATRKDGDGTKAGIVEIPAFWVDVDFGKMTSVQLEELRKKDKELPIKPSASVNSGGGYHGYWLLKEPATQEDLRRIEDILNRLADYFYGDTGATDASRILRLPGTLNHKYNPSRMVSLNKIVPESQYNLDDFDFFPKVSRSRHPGSQSRPSEGWEKELLKGVEHGERNVSITQLAGRYIGKGLSREEILPILLEANSRFRPPLDSKEIETILDSVIKTHRRNHSEFRADPNYGGHHFSLIQAKDISLEGEVDWIWEGVLPAGGLSLVVAKPKVGKTTFSFNLAVALSRGEAFLGRKTRQGTVVYLALEEKKGEVLKNLSKMGVVDEPLYFHFGPAPREAIKEVESLIKDKGAKFLVIDILQKFCRVKDLNDYSQVTNALEPLMATARQLNCHIQLVHHAGKRDRDDGDDILGSTGLLGGVDTSIHIKKREKRRTFFTIQRYGEDISETVITLKGDGSLEATGSREEVEIEETIPLVLESLDGGPMIEKEIWERVKKDHSLVSRGLRKLLEQNKISRTGKGKRGDPFVYEKNSLFLSLDTIEESKREIKSGSNFLESFHNNSLDDFVKNGSCQERIKRDILGENEAKKGSGISLYEGEI
jgi:hypothetical protein